MKTIYLAGNIAYTNHKEAYNWRYEIKKELKNYFNIIIPTDMKDAKKCMNRDFEYIKKCDIFLGRIKKDASWGTGIEIYFAHFLKKEIILFTTENIHFHGWLKVLANKTLKVKDNKEIINYLKKLK